MSQPNLSYFQPFTWSRLALLSLCLVLTLILPACSKAPEPPLRIGTNVWPGYEPLYLARSLGYYQSTSVKLVEMLSASQTIQALRTGTLDGAALTLDEVMLLLADKVDLRVILVMDFSHGGDVLMAKPAIKSLDDLRGKEVVVETSAVGALLLDGALTEAGLDIQDIKLKVCPIDEHVNCFASADAAVTFEPVKTILLKQGAHQLFNSSQIPGRIVDVLVVLTKTIQTHPDSLRQLLTGYFKARDHLATQTEDAVSRMAPRLGIKPDELLSAYDGLKLPDLDENKNLLKGNPSHLQKSANTLSTLMFKKKLLRNKLAIENLTDKQFLPSEKP